MSFGSSTIRRMPIARVVRAAWVLAMVLLAAGCATASLTPSPTETPASPLATASPAVETDGGRVTSPRFGWSAVVPAGWRFRQATEDWPPRTNPLPGARYTDNLEHDSGFPVFDVSTQVLPAGQSREDFLADLDRFGEALGCDVETEEETTVDGQAARLQRQSCAGGMETVWEVIVFDGDRVYAMYWLSLVDDADTDEPLFRETLETFRFADSGPAG
jgi:hypothetical protein